MADRVVELTPDAETNRPPEIVHRWRVVRASIPDGDLIYVVSEGEFEIVDELGRRR